MASYIWWIYRIINCVLTLSRTNERRLIGLIETHNSKKITIFFLWASCCSIISFLGSVLWTIVPLLIFFELWVSINPIRRLSFVLLNVSTQLIIPPILYTSWLLYVIYPLPSLNYEKKVYTVYTSKFNKNVNIKFPAHDAFLE
jgi:hypothetical protein